MESLKLGGGCNMAELGKQLALMHLAEPAVSLVVCESWGSRLFVKGVDEGRCVSVVQARAAGD